MLCVSGSTYMYLHRRTAGSVSAALPPSRTEMVEAFDKLHRPELPGCALTVGARALAKHVHRGADGYWAGAAGGGKGGLTGGDRQKSLRAKAALHLLLSNAAWANTHALPGDVRFERQLCPLSSFLLALPSRDWHTSLWLPSPPCLTGALSAT